MYTSRRRFLHAAAAGAVVPVIGPRVLDVLERRLEAFGNLSPSAAAVEEDYWREIRRVFPVPADYINLENGFSSPQPAATFEAFQRHEVAINSGLSYYMRRKKADDQVAVKKQLAELAGCPADEIVITRNTTESLGTVTHGLDLAPGDEAVMCNQDYGSMLEQFRQQSRRRGLKCVEIAIPLHPTSDEEMVETYARALTPRTKILLLSHMVNITGQILPVRKIADMAHARGVSVMVDAAHSFAHVVFKVPDLDGDYFGASLHKWLCTPLGAGILHIKKEKIRGVWPLFGETSVPDDDIRKFERIGTQPSWTVLAIADAIRFHNAIGGERKEARLRYLQQVLDRSGSRHSEGPAEYARRRPGLRHRERRHHRDDPRGPRPGALRQVQGLHGRHRHARGEGDARHAAPVHDDRGPRRAGEGTSGTRRVSEERCSSQLVHPPRFSVSVVLATRSTREREKRAKAVMLGTHVFCK